MTDGTSIAPIDRALGEEAVDQVRQWLEASRNQPVDAAAQRLAGVLQDPNGLAFTVGFVDGVVRPEDPRAAARALRDIAPLTPAFLPAPLRAAVKTGAAAGRVVPGVVVPTARTALRQMVRHLIVDATDKRLGRSIHRIKGDQDGVRLNINLLGEAVLGEAEATKRLADTEKLLARDDVDYVSIKVSSTVSPHSPWSFDDAVQHAAEALLPLYRRAVAEGGKFINLDMEEYKDLDLTLEVFTSILDREEFLSLEAGVVLQAYLPDALAAMHRLQEWAAARVARGGAPVKVRLVKGANLPMEEVDAEVHGWPLATWHSKQASDSCYKAVLDYALQPAHVKNLRVGVAGHNLFDIALAWLLAKQRGVTEGIDIEMLLGMATAQAAAVRADVGSLLLYTPVVRPEEFDVAIAYLIRRLEEGASQENFMSAMFELDDPTFFDREKERFLASIDTIPAEVPVSHRCQDRRRPAAAWTGAPGEFVNTPDTDPSIEANREWGQQIRSKMQGSRLGRDLAKAGEIQSVAQVEALIEETATAGAAWRDLSAAARAEILHRAGDVLEARRADLLEVMGSECGKVLEQGDPEVSEAIDFAHYYAERGRELESVEGARFSPSRLTVVTPPWNFPCAIPAGSTLAALASGSPVIIKPAPQARRTGAVMVEALWEAGVPRDVLRYVQVPENEVGSRLITHETVERVVLTGAYETAQLFRSMRPDLPLLAETSGKNALIVTPSADLDLAAKDVAYSAFGHAGQKCSAASLTILVGTVATSERFRRQLIDAVQSMTVGLPWEEASQVGPVIEPAQGKLLDALTVLPEGQSWLVEPRRLDEDGMLWSPGVRDGVKPGSEYHLTEYFGPVLGVMAAPTLEAAIDYVNQIDYGLTSGIHSLDEDEVATWLGSVQAGNLYVNRGITGAIVQRQPFGGWKKAAVGAGCKAGGPNYLVGFGTWSDESVSRSANDEISQAVLDAAHDLDHRDREWLAGALSTDAVAWASEFGVVQDRTGLEREQNAFRYHQVPVTVRYEGSRVVELLRVVAAGVRAGSAITVSTMTRIAPPVMSYLQSAGVEVAIEDATEWTRRAGRLAESGGRVRLIDADAGVVAAATGGSPAVAIYAGEVVSAGRVEVLTFLREQAVSITAHRFGTPRRYDIPAAV